MTKKIVMLAGKDESTNFIYNALNENFFIDHIVQENKVSRKKFIQRRIKKQGYIKVVGQILFQLFIPKLLKIFSKERIENIKAQYNLIDDLIPTKKLIAVESINSKTCIEFLKKEKPDLVIVNGTRIISKKVLNSTSATFINIHAGITPKYRGVHGGYWAIANKDEKNCGVTIHCVDAGIDTGSVLKQQLIKPSNKDNFVTYPYIQIGEGINLFNEVLQDFSKNQLKETQIFSKESKLWYHPTLWFYIINRLFRGIK